MESRIKLVHHTFRIPDHLKRELEREVRETGNSSSALLIKLLDNYFERDKPFEQLGFMLIGKDLVRRWMDRMDEEILREDARELGSQVVSEYVAHMYHRVDGEVLVEFLNVWFRKISEYSHQVNDKTHNYSVVHDVNIRFSIFLTELLEALIEEITNKPVTFVRVTPNLIAFSFEV